MSDDFDSVFQSLCTDVASAVRMEATLSGKPMSKSIKTQLSRCRHIRQPVEILENVLGECKKKRKLLHNDDEHTVSDEHLSKMARFTDKFKLAPYKNFLHFVPRIVNVVTRELRLNPQHARMLICRLNLQLRRRYQLKGRV